MQAVIVPVIPSAVPWRQTSWSGISTLPLLLLTEDGTAPMALHTEQGLVPGLRAHTCHASRQRRSLRGPMAALQGPWGPEPSSASPFGWAPCQEPPAKKRPLLGPHAAILPLHDPEKLTHVHRETHTKVSGRNSESGW